MAPFIRLRLFSRSEEPSLYEQYRALKYEVFVAEQGWTALADRSGLRVVQEEEFDGDGQLCLASMPDGDPVGVVRGIALAKGFPHRELLEHHLARAEVQGMWDGLGTLNALAVLPTYRGKMYRAMDLGWRGSAAKLLMLFAIDQMEQRGLRAALATTGGLAPMRLCRGLGFLVIDCPAPIPHLHPTVVATNVGMVFGSSRHLQAQQECAMRVEPARPLGADSLRLQAYFEERQAKVLGGRGLDVIIPPQSGEA